MDLWDLVSREILAENTKSKKNVLKKSNTIQGAAETLGGKEL